MHKNTIVFTIDENYIEPFIVATQSFMSFHDNSKYTFVLLHSNLKKYHTDKIEKYFYLNNLELIIKKIDDIFTDIVVGYHFNSVIFYRLLIPSLFPKHEKILYIDSDIVFTDTIDDIFKVDLKNNILAAIPKHQFFEIPNHMKSKNQKYFASGLLLINTAEFIKYEIDKKCLNFLKNEKYDMPDQDALNTVVDKWLELDLNYGVETAFLESRDLSLKEKIKYPKVIQFSGLSKPWHFRNKHPYKKLYWKYLRMTPFKRYIPEDLTIINVIKWMIPKSIKEFVKGKIK